MKYVLLMIFSIGLKASATPVLDQGVGTVIPYASTVLPDDTDKNLFYFFPYHYGLSQLGNRKALSCLQSYLASGASTVECNMIFESVISPDTTGKIQEVKAANPQSRFAPVPYTKTSIIVTKNTHPLLSAINCQLDGSQTGQQMECNWTVIPSRYESLRKMLLENALVQVMQYSAQYTAIVQGKKTTVAFAIPIYVSDLGTGDYFFDNNGNVLH